jgi:glycosyltransferase involved in cell wall biosynthesis
MITPPWVPVPPPAYGGLEAVVDALARGLREAGHEVLLYATGDSTCEVSRRWVLPAAVGTQSATPATELRHVVNAYEDIARWGADIVHDHTLVGPVYGRGSGLPIVTTNHGPFAGELGDYYRAIAPSVPVIAISQAQAAEAPDIPIAAVIHHGIEVERFPHQRTGGDYALFLGRMSPDKGVHRAARIARLAGVPLKIAAKLREPAEEAYFREEVAPLLGDGVELVGEVGGRAKLDLLAGARCLLNPIAWSEPFGLVMIEALACGTPVVATPCGSVPEIVDDGVTGLIRVSDDELAGAVRAAGFLDRALCRKAAEARFCTSRMVADHVELYERVVAGTAGATTAEAMAMAGTGVEATVEL